MTHTQIAERKNVYRRLRNLSDHGVRQVLELIDTLEKHEPSEESIDPFYSEANMKRLRKAIADVESGRTKLTEHELIEVDDE